MLFQLLDIEPVFSFLVSRVMDNEIVLTVVVRTPQSCFGGICVVSGVTMKSKKGGDSGCFCDMVTGGELKLWHSLRNARIADRE